MPMINITYNPSMNDSIRDLRYRYKEIKYTHISGSPDKPGGLSIQLCKSEKKEFYIRYSS